MELSLVNVNSNRILDKNVLLFFYFILHLPFIKQTPLTIRHTRSQLNIINPQVILYPYNCKSPNLSRLVGRRKSPSAMCYVDMCLLLLYVNVLYRHAPWYTHCCTHATVSCQMNAAGMPTPSKSCYIYLLTQTMGHFIPLKRHVGSVAFPICFISFSSSNMLLYIANRVMESYCKLSLSSLGFSMILIWNRNSEKKWNIYTAETKLWISVSPWRSAAHGRSIFFPTTTQTWWGWRAWCQVTMATEAEWGCMSKSVFGGGEAQRDGGVSGEWKVGRREEIVMESGTKRQR